MQLLERIQRERSMALVVITHYPEIAARATRRIELRDGLVVAQDRSTDTDTDTGTDRTTDTDTDTDAGGAP
jgi:putative ABC transport system ATP-binding protein